MAAEQQNTAFQTYPVEKQFEIYQCGMQLEPPAMGFAWDIAARGEQITPFILDKLKTEGDERRQRDIILIFAAMSSRGYLRNRSDIIDLIGKMVDSMTNADAKDSSQKILDRIRQNIADDHPPM